MGEPKFARPKFDTPSHPWKKARIEEEHSIRDNHGLKTMREIWKAKSQRRDVHMGFVDISKAYDSVNRGILWNSVQNSHIECRTLPICRATVSRGFQK